MDKDSGNDFDIGIGLLDSLQILSTVFLTGFELISLNNYINRVGGKVFIEVVVTWNKIVKLLYVLERRLNPLLSPLVTIIKYQGVMKSMDSPLKCLTSLSPNC